MKSVLDTTIPWLPDKLRHIYIYIFCMRNKAGGKETMLSKQNQKKKASFTDRQGYKRQNVTTLLTL